MQNFQSMDYKYSSADDTSCVFVPQKLQCSMGIQEFLTNSQKYLCTFQLFIDATKTTNFGSKQRNLFLECGFERVEYGSVFTRNHMCRDPLVNLYSCLINLLTEVATLIGKQYTATRRITE